MNMYNTYVHVKIHIVIESFGDADCHVEHNGHPYLKATNSGSHLSTSSTAVLDKLGDL